MEEKITEFLNTPAGLIVLGGALLISLVIIILGNTSFGRKAIRNIKNSFDYEKESNKSFKEGINKQISLNEKSYDKLKNETNEEINELKNVVVEALSCINNKKVEKLITEYKAKKVSADKLQATNDKSLK